MTNEKLLIIGGSPCSGKSTVAERIAQEYGAYYFKVDDYLSEFLKRAAEKGYSACAGIQRMTPEEIWMRDPAVQCEEEFLIYDEISDMVFDCLDKIDAALIVTEGAAFTPDVISKWRVKKYIAIVPTPEFQISHYKEREWVQYILEGCSDKKKAFDNWMERDVLFAREVMKKCEENKVACLVNDGFRDPDEIFSAVKELFGL